jgi:anaerobic carbon-monoxide dehydrogenase catalytic subunit
MTTEKAVAIGTWAVTLGLLTHIGGQPYVSGSANLVKLLTEGVEGLAGGKFLVVIDPEVAAKGIIAAIALFACPRFFLICLSPFPSLAT